MDMDIYDPKTVSLWFWFIFGHFNAEILAFYAHIIQNLYLNGCKCIPFSSNHTYMTI